MGIREDVLALADDVEATVGGCVMCIADKPGGRCLSDDSLECSDAICREVAKRLREIVEHDAGEVTTVSAYDLLPDEDRKAIAWVREHGGLDEVEKRLMPEGVEWPRYEDGELVRIGESIVVDGEPREACAFEFDGETSVYWGIGEYVSLKPGERVKRPAPKVLDADGVEIRVGDKLYDTDTGCARIVRAINASGTVEFEGYEDRGWFTRFLTHRAPVFAADARPLHEGEHVYHVETGAELVVKELPKPGEYQAVVVFAPPASHPTSFDPNLLTHQRPVLGADGVPIREGDTVYVLGFGEPLTVRSFAADGRVLMDYHNDDSLGYKPSKLTHEQPDTWQRIEDDAKKNACEVFHPGEAECGGCRFEGKDNCEEELRLELVKRCRALAERGE